MLLSVVEPSQTRKAGFAGNNFSSAESAERLGMQTVVDCKADVCLPLHAILAQVWLALEERRRFCFFALSEAMEYMRIVYSQRSIFKSNYLFRLLITNM